MPPVQQNLAPFFRRFGEAAVLDGRCVEVIWDAPGTRGDMVDAVDPQVQIRTADVPADYFGKPLKRAGVAYTVREHLPDGTGMSLLTLSNAA